MTHEPYSRIAKDGNTAVLFIHGILGTPRHFDAFLPLIPAHVSIVNLLLDGHGKGVHDFSKSSMQKWIAQVDDVIAELSRTHKRIIIAAHSMGTLFALREAVAHPDRIAALFLLAVPLKLSIKARMVQNVWNIFRGTIREDDARGMAAKHAYGIADDRRAWRYVGWIPRYLELFQEIRNTRQMLPMLTVPTHVYQSAEDEMVSYRAGEIMQTNPHVSLHVLEKSAHYYYEEDDLARLLSDFASLLVQIL